jgi:hypothetical protein
MSSAAKCRPFDTHSLTRKKPCPAETERLFGALVCQGNSDTVQRLMERTGQMINPWKTWIAGARFHFLIPCRELQPHLPSYLRPFCKSGKLAVKRAIGTVITLWDAQVTGQWAARQFSLCHVFFTTFKLCFLDPVHHVAGPCFLVENPFVSIQHAHSIGIKLTCERKVEQLFRERLTGDLHASGLFLFT